MMSNWPLIHAAVSADGFDIAAAGSRGLALYSRRSCKWRLFGDVSQERSICTMAVIWLPKAGPPTSTSAAKVSSLATSLRLHLIPFPPR